MKRGRLELYLALLFGYNGVTANTRVTQIFCEMTWNQATKYTPFLEEHGFLEKVPHKGTKHTFRRTEKGEKLVKYLLEGDMRCFLDALDANLLEIYRKSEEDRKSPYKRPSVHRSLAEQKMSVLELLKYEERYTISRITSYSLATLNNINQVLEELEKDGMIVLYPTKHKVSKGKYGITQKGRSFISTKIRL